jgi:hypothetical protein
MCSGDSVPYAGVITIIFRLVRSFRNELPYVADFHVIGVFPVAATGLFMGVVIKYDAAKPSDGTHCASFCSNSDKPANSTTLNSGDVTDPIWCKLNLHEWHTQAE